MAEWELIGFSWWHVEIQPKIACDSNAKQLWKIKMISNARIQMTFGIIPKSSLIFDGIFHSFSWNFVFIPWKFRSICWIFIIPTFEIHTKAIAKPQVKGAKIECYCSRKMTPTRIQALCYIRITYKFEPKLHVRKKCRKIPRIWDGLMKLKWQPNPSNFYFFVYELEKKLGQLFGLVRFCAHTKVMCTLEFFKSGKDTYT